MSSLTSASPLPSLVASPVQTADRTSPVLQVLAVRQINDTRSSLTDALLEAVEPGNVLTGTVTSSQLDGTFTLTTKTGVQVTLHHPPEQPLTPGSTVTLRVVSNGPTPQAALLQVDGRPVTERAPPSPQAPPPNTLPPAAGPAPPPASTSSYSAALVASLGLAEEALAEQGSPQAAPLTIEATLNAPAPVEATGPTLLAILVRSAPGRPGLPPVPIGTRYLVTVQTVDGAVPVLASPITRASTPANPPEAVPIEPEPLPETEAPLVVARPALPTPTFPGATVAPSPILAAPPPPGVATPEPVAAAPVATPVAAPVATPVAAIPEPPAGILVEPMPLQASAPAALTPPAPTPPAPSTSPPIGDSPNPPIPPPAQAGLPEPSAAPPSSPKPPPIPVTPAEPLPAPVPLPTAPTPSPSAATLQATPEAPIAPATGLPPILPLTTPPAAGLSAPAPTSPPPEAPQPAETAVIPGNPAPPTPPDPADFQPQVTQLVGRIIDPRAEDETLVETAVGTLALPIGNLGPPGAATQIRVSGVAPPAAPATTPHAAPQGSGQPTPQPLTPLVESLTASLVSQPALAAEIQSVLAVPPGPRLAALLFAFLAGVRQGSRPRGADPAFRNALNGLDRKDLAARLDSALDEIGRVEPQHGPDGWTITTLPFLGAVSLAPMRLYRRTHGAQDEPGDEAQRPGERFVVEVQLERIGALQFDGLVRDRRFDLALRTNAPLDSSLRAEIETVYRDALLVSGWSGEIAFARAQRIPLVPVTPRLTHLDVGA